MTSTAIHTSTRALQPTRFVEKWATVATHASKSTEALWADTKPAQVARSFTTKVKYGETLNSIAEKRGVSVEKICRLNGYKKDKKLTPGQIIRYS